MKRAAAMLFLAAGLVLLITSAPTMAADARSESPDPHVSSVGADALGPVDLNFMDHPRDGHREKPKPKRRDPGRQNMSGLEAVCVNDGFLDSLFGGLLGLARNCNDGGESILPGSR